MRSLIQRVTSASVQVEDKIISEIGSGLVVLLGITHNDSVDDSNYLINKILNLRIFGDENSDNFELSLLDTNKEILIISQFTLYADTKKGRRPSFIESAKSDVAKKIYDEFISLIKTQTEINVKTGIFGAKMLVNINNDGPVTISMDSR
ncbi:MAG: D-tyrosyl-tRNA(Tyr) deacylase [SAR202 cluster bacterium]|mgnify:FL=1|nr:MAG: D-tyrosyl-tRNA(Tyr) deacylase [SAR202 cluster bacterium]KAA1300287.1 MAG: D-tyrosyl-tRNA(Tyr) deacylase [SAR202 cluster bacterium]MQG12061.1 D-tyrosyl-tRNA(Tyr) deacylase [SAR202 cluster bacterium]